MKHKLEIGKSFRIATPSGEKEVCGMTHLYRALTSEEAERMILAIGKNWVPASREVIREYFKMDRNNYFFDIIALGARADVDGIPQVLGIIRNHLLVCYRGRRWLSGTCFLAERPA
jgi:hypothetical protein